MTMTIVVFEQLLI